MPPVSVSVRESVIGRFRWLIVAFSRDLAGLAVSTFLAFDLRFDGSVPRQYQSAMGLALVVWLSTKLLAFILIGVNRGLWQYTSFYDAQRVALANTAGSILGCLIIIVLSGPTDVPRSIYILEWIISSLVLLAGRFAIRTATTLKNRKPEGEGTRTLIYGAGSAGLQLLWEARQNRALLCNVVGLIDDDQSKIGLILDGKRVLGTGEQLRGLAEKHAVKRVLIAIPSATGSQMMRILKRSADADIEYKMVPSLGELIRDKRLDGQIRNIAVEDLLGRQSVQLDQRPISERLRGQVVLVTGAAGSIGSELCRQIARFHPRSLVGFDQAETPLFQIDRELCKSFPGLAFHPEIGDITDMEDLQRVMQQYCPTIVYHAAAYKHVPLMEKHVFCAVKNNIIGTWQTALASIRNGVEDFVMISTDKAVRPTSVMGATKRIAEMVIRGLQEESHTKFVAVRFGNVLGSNGSVVPIFKEQIAAGGPITVTHPEMRRYFMTIPEAAQLVLQAFSFGKDGDVFLLDMGEPVRIVDLAINLILLSGLKPEKDIRIQFTGLRPGEKLFEELNLQNESLLSTSHAKIRRYASPSSLDRSRLKMLIRDLQRTIDDKDSAKLLSILEENIPDYHPSGSVLKAAANQSSSNDRDVSVIISQQNSSIPLSALPEVGY